MAQGNYGKVYAKIGRDTTFSREARILYMCLAMRADKNRKCYPSIYTLIKETGMCKTTLYKAMRELVDRGVVVKTSRIANNLKVGITYWLTDTL